MLVGLLLVLPLDQLLELLDKGWDEDRADHAEEDEDPKENHCQVGTNVLEVVVETPHLVLGDHFFHIKIKWKLRINILGLVNQGSRYWFQLHEGAWSFDSDGSRLINDSIGTVRLVHRIWQFQLDFGWFNFLLSKSLLFASLGDNFRFVNKSIQRIVWAWIEIILISPDNDVFGNLLTGVSFRALEDPDQMIILIIEGQLCFSPWGLLDFLDGQIFKLAVVIR